jgi:hypothetical protein
MVPHAAPVIQMDDHSTLQHVHVAIRDPVATLGNNILLIPPCHDEILGDGLKPVSERVSALSADDS